MDNQTPDQIIFFRIQDMASAAMQRYNERYDNQVYLAATAALPTANANLLANLLTDDALHLCGHPHYRMSNRDWSVPALKFLALFC